MLLTSWIAGSCLTLFACSETVNAGVLMDALINNRNAAYPAQTYRAATPVTAGYAPVANYANVVSNYGTYTSNYAPAVTPANSGYGPIPVGVQQTVPSYLPTAQYDTVWNRTPVTYYRPVTSFDPRLGTTVTSLQPCTGYQYQASRVPMIAPRAVLGEYGLQSNQWPAITGPGYNPAGLGVTANYPGYQTLPNSGTFAPYGNSGTSIGMPASSLPVTTFPTAPAVPINPAPMPNNVTSGYPTSVAPVSSYPAYSTPTTYRPQPSSFTQPDGSIWTPLPNGQVNAPMTQMQTPIQTQMNAVLPATSYSPAMTNGVNNNCPNGMCPLPGASSSVVNPQFNQPQYSSPPTFPSSNVPSFPGATSVQPIGQPTYGPAPTGGYVPITPGVGNNAVLPNNSNTSTYAPGAQGGMGGVADPESMRQPSFNGSSSVQKATTDHLVNSAEQTNRADRPAVSEPPLHGGMLPWNRESQSPASDPKPAPVDRSGKLEIPSTLPSTETNRGSYKANPLRAPDGLDTKALWNPDFVGPVESNGRSGNDKQSQATTPAAKQNDAPIRFISGGLNSRKDNANANQGIYFREITPAGR
jgi:hypothetical protein